MGLVLFALTDKLCFLIGLVADLSLPADDLERLRSDLRCLRDVVGGLADVDPRGFMNVMVSSLALALMVFRTGRAPDPGNVLYQQLSTQPVSKAVDNLDFPSAALGRFATVISLLGRGLAEGSWRLASGTPDRPGDGIVRVTTGHQTSRVFVVADSRALSQLEVDGVVDLDDDDAVVIQAEATKVAATRSPRSHYGRTGGAGARCIDLEDLCASVTSADELFEAFKLEGAL
jgi:hypothetical protein